MRSGGNMTTLLVVPAQAGTHRATPSGRWNMGPRLRGDDTAGVAERTCGHSDSAMGALNSEVAPSLEVTVAVNDAGTAPGASTVSARRS